MASSPTIGGVKPCAINGDCGVSCGGVLYGITNEKEDHPMNLDTFEGQWTHMRGEITSWWDKLTDADLENVAGKKAALVALVQEKYQYTRERAQQEVDQRLQEYSDKSDKLGASGASRMIETVQETAQNVASSLAETAGEVKAHAEAAASTAATAVADTMAGAVSSLQETSVKDLAGKLTDLIRRHPIPSLLIGLGVGFVLARILDKPTTGQGA
jgi:uncharacterized protein YjbJ (UPF0337 family)/ElaB/YqjD/DUF883 family membrane-anchored ribosome-binding protein